jgi:hypothetical protein
MNSKVNLQPTSKSIPKPANAKPHYEPTPHQQAAKRSVPVKPPIKKSMVAPTAIISGSELDELRSFNRKMQTERETVPMQRSSQEAPSK